MAEITDLKLEIVNGSERLEPTLEGLTSLITVTMMVQLDPQSESDRDGYDGTFRILGGPESDREVLFTMRWGGWIRTEFRGVPLELPLFIDRFSVTLENGTEQTISRTQRVLRADLNEDPGVEIRFSESVPPGLTPKAIPHPDNHFPWDYPLAPWPIREEAIDQITAQAALIRRSPHKPAMLAESNTVFGTF